MVELPPEILRDHIEQGSVYLFHIDEFPEKKHFCVILNKHPSEDCLIIYVYITKNIEAVVRCNRSPECTLVTIDPGEYSVLSVPSIINCNKVMRITLDELIEKKRQQKLYIKTKLPEEILNKIKNGVLASPLVVKIFKNLI